MKKMAWVFAGLLLVGGVSAHAQEINGAGGFVTLKAGSGNLSTPIVNTSGFSYAVSAGYRWALPGNQALGVELGYLNQGRVHHDFQGVAQASEKGHALTVGPTYRFTFGDGTRAGDYFASVRTGYMRWHGNARASSSETLLLTTGDKGNGWYAGVGFGHDFSPHASVSLNYDFYRANASYYHVNLGFTSLAMEYRF